MEEWRSIPAWPEYEASDEGRIRRVGGKPLRPAAEKRAGHLNVSLWHGGVGKKQWVHRLVCSAFHGPAPSGQHHAAHRDGNPANNRPTNLRWATPLENAADKKIHGTENMGAQNGMAKLTPLQVMEIKRRASSLPRSSGGCRIKKGALGALASEYGVTRDCLYQIIAGICWAHLSETGEA